MESDDFTRLARKLAEHNGLHRTATLIPWPKRGLDRQIRSAIGTNPRGQRSSLWKCRRTLAGKP